MCHSFSPSTCLSFSLFNVYSLNFIFLFSFFLHGCWYLHWNPVCFCFHPLIAPPPSLTHASTKQPVKVKRKKSFNLSRKFPFYKSKENIVQELVESEREYQLCDRGEGGLSPPFPFMLQFCLSPSIFSLTSTDGLCDGTTLIPSSLSQRDSPLTEPAWWGWSCGGSSLVWPCICLWAPEEYLAVRAASCVGKFSAELAHGPSNTVMLFLV